MRAWRDAAVTTGILAALTFLIWAVTIPAATACGAWAEANGSTCYPQMASAHEITGPVCLVLLVFAGFSVVMARRA